MAMSGIGFLGCGNMASAFIRGLVEKGSMNYSKIYIHTRTKERASVFLNRGANWCENPAELADTCGLIFLCVKPQQIEEPLKELAPFVKEDTLVVSMLAGKSISYFHGFFERKVPVIRIMPNTPLVLGCGATAVSADERVSTDDLTTVTAAIGLMGKVVVIPEEQMDAIVAVNGSSPAYFYQIAKIMTDWAVSKGIDPKAALSLVTQTMLGSARMLNETDKTPEQLIREVSSPGGTTLAALASFDRDGLDEVFYRAMSACEKRSRELTVGNS